MLVISAGIPSNGTTSGRKRTNTPSETRDAACMVERGLEGSSVIGLVG